MSGFIRRYGAQPGVETITLIEGVIIVDAAPPGSVQGTTTGTVALVGEFADVTYGTAVDSSGVVTTRSMPVEILSGQDLLDKVGGFDPTLGNFGVADGNGFAALRNKKFTRLVVAPVNMASAAAGRVWRDLPTNLSSTQAVPVVPMAGGLVAAGREFKTGSQRVRLAAKATFTALGQFKNGTDGAVTNTGTPAATMTFNSATGGFLSAYNGGAVKKGQLLVLGVISGAGALGANAATYRVTADAVSDTALVVEKLDGTNFDWTTGTALPYRIHPQSDGDVGGPTPVNAKLSDVSGYQLPCRPTVSTVAAATALTPVVAASAGTATTWDPLSGLTLYSHPSSGFVYTAAIQAPNAVNHASIDALYATALDGLKQDVAPSRDVNIVWCARVSSTIRNALSVHVQTVSATGVGRVACLSPQLSTVTSTAACADTDPGVGANRTDLVFYSWPGVRTSIPEAVGYSLGTADGLATSDGILDTRGDGWLAATLSNLPPELNPGQSGEPVSSVLAPILGIQRGVNTLEMGDYINMRKAGVCGLRIDRSVGPVFQSGVTTSLVSGLKNIARRRMAFFIQDSVAQRLVQFAKKAETRSRKDNCLLEIDSFLAGLLSEGNPDAQRIAGYVLDDKSGNTPAAEAQGIYVIIGKVRTLASMDFIVFQTSIGEGVITTTVQ